MSRAIVQVPHKNVVYLSIYLTRNPNSINYFSPDLANKLLYNNLGPNVLERSANRERAITIWYYRCNGKETIVPNHC